MIIVIANSKGGVGKSTIAVHLVAWLHQQGHSVTLADCDTQQSSSEWAKEAVPEVKTVRLSAPDEILDRLPILGQQTDFVVADGPGSNTETSRALLLRADLAIVPCKASMLEVRALAQATNVLRQAQDIRGGQPRVRFIFGLDKSWEKHVSADDLQASAWQKLDRPHYHVKTQPRQKRKRVKEQIVRQREFENKRLVSEDVAEMPYRPVACKNTYRLIVVRKNLSVEKGEVRLFNDYVYFYYLTNDWTSSPAEIVFEANQRCNQENLHAQLKGGVRALQAPLDNLESNWAYMVMTALAWSLKA